MSPIHLRLRELRLSRELTQVELARRTGLDQAVISRIENQVTGGMDYRVLEALCDALDCEPGDLLKREGKQKKRRGQTGR